MKRKSPLFFLLLLSALMAGCDPGNDTSEDRLEDPFEKVANDWEKNGTEYRFYTRDAAHGHKIQEYMFSRSSCLDRVVTVKARKLQGNPTSSYGMKICNLSDSDDHISFLVSDDGYSIVTVYVDGKWSGRSSDWLRLDGMATGLAVEHTLEAVFDSSAGTMSFAVDGIGLAHTVEVGRNFRFLAGFQCYTRTPSEAMPYDFRFGITSPFVSP